MGKYEPLGQFLRKQKRDRIPMTFVEIEQVLNAKLPASKNSRAFWSNNPDNNVMTRVWVEAGFETSNVNTKVGELLFVREGLETKPKNNWEQIYGCMKGVVKFSPGFDPTEPAFDEKDWGDGSIGGYHSLGNPDEPAA